MKMRFTFLLDLVAIAGLAFSQTRTFRLRNCFEQTVPIIQDQPGINATRKVVDGARTRVFSHDGLQHVG